MILQAQKNVSGVRFFFSHAGPLGPGSGDRARGRVPSLMSSVYIWICEKKKKKERRLKGQSQLFCCAQTEKYSSNLEYFTQVTRDADGFGEEVF